jgi:hypothetical protein
VRDCPSTSPERHWPCVLPDDSVMHFGGHRSEDIGPGPSERWTTTRADWDRWQAQEQEQDDEYAYGPVWSPGRGQRLRDRRVETIDLTGKDLL